MKRNSEFQSNLLKRWFSRSDNQEERILQEFRGTRSQTLFSVRFILLLILIPLLVNQATKTFLADPLVEKLWFDDPTKVFLNQTQSERAIAEFQKFERLLRFQTLIQRDRELSAQHVVQRKQEKTLEIVNQARNDSIHALSSIFADSLSGLAFLAVLYFYRSKTTILKRFMNSTFYGLSDSAKAFLIILSTNLFVGFHSAYGWEIILEQIFLHFGLAENRSFISMFIAIVPVTLDVVVKYWIFRYLNRSSPSAVVTYRSMNQ